MYIPIDRDDIAVGQPSQGSVNWTQKGEEQGFKVTQGFQQSHFSSVDEIPHLSKVNVHTLKVLNNSFPDIFFLHLPFYL